MNGNIIPAGKIPAARRYTLTLAEKQLMSKKIIKYLQAVITEVHKSITMNKVLQKSKVLKISLHRERLNYQMR